MRTLSAQALREAVSNKAASDSAFSAELRQDSGQTIEKLFGKQPYSVRIVYRQPSDLSLLVPHKTVALEQVINRAIADLGDREPTKGEVNALVVKRAWNDPAFAKQLAEAPEQALNAVLKPYKTSVPAGKQVRAYFEGATECVIVISEAAGHELTDEELEAVAGGESVAIVATTAIVSAVVTETLCS
jgi:hypothetical protein